MKMTIIRYLVDQEVLSIFKIDKKKLLSKFMTKFHIQSTTQLQDWQWKNKQTSPKHQTVLQSTPNDQEQKWSTNENSSINNIHPKKCHLWLGIHPNWIIHTQFIPHLTELPQLCVLMHNHLRSSALTNRYYISNTFTTRILNNVASPQLSLGTQTVKLLAQLFAVTVASPNLTTDFCY